jgi:hypothetical protein
VKDLYHYKKIVNKKVKKKMRKKESPKNENPRADLQIKETPGKDGVKVRRARSKNVTPGL